MKIPTREYLAHWFKFTFTLGLAIGLQGALLLSLVTFFSSQFDLYPSAFLLASLLIPAVLPLVPLTFCATTAASLKMAVPRAVWVWLVVFEILAAAVLLFAPLLSLILLLVFPTLAYLWLCWKMSRRQLAPINSARRPIQLWLVALAICTLAWLANEYRYAHLAPSETLHIMKRTIDEEGPALDQGLSAILASSLLTSKCPAPGNLLPAHDYHSKFIDGWMDGVFAYFVFVPSSCPDIRVSICGATIRDFKNPNLVKDEAPKLLSAVVVWDQQGHWSHFDNSGAIVEGQSLSDLSQWSPRMYGCRLFPKN